MGAYLAKPNTEKSSENGTNNSIRYGVSCMQGWRITMEDAHTCMLAYDDNAALFAVYDGHGGSEVAQYAAKHLPDMLKSMETFQKGEIKQSLIDAFLEVDTAMISEEGLEELRQLAGSDKDDVDEDEDIGMLEQEAAIPLQELLAKMKEMKKARNDAFEIEDNEFEEQWSTSDKQDCCASKKESGQTDESSGGQSESKGGKEKVESNGSVNEDVNCQPDSTETEKLEKGEKEKAKEEKTAEEEASRHKNEVTSSGNGDNSCGPCSSVCGDNDDEDSEGEDDDSSEDEDGNDDDNDDDDGYDDDDDSDNDNSELPLQSSDEVGYDSGTTAIVALLRDNHLTVANVGDSRCVLCRNGIALDMSVDHKPEDKQELDRIHKAGGKVTCEGRVNGGLNLSRALGDHSYKLQTELSAHEQQITAVPDVRQTEITEADEFMVVACDGIWNVKGSQEVVDFVSDQLREQRSKNEVDLKCICEKLMDSCLAPDTSGDGSGCDNMTCIIVLFESPQPFSKKRKSEEEQVDGDLVDKRSRTEEF